jgi:phytoene desaturase (3,4-didehydrolycopene-forming)
LIPDQPSFYVNVPSRIDASAAPAGCDALVVLVPVGHLFDDKSETHRGAQNSPGVTQDWDTMVSSARETIIATIEKRLKISLKAHIVDEFVNTPPSWKTAFNLDRGAILGLSHSFFNVLSFRPKTQHPTINDLYFVGASTHPGTGVPIVLAGAKLVTDQVMKNLGLAHRLQETKMGGGSMTQSGSPLDAPRRTGWYAVVQWLVALLLTLFIAVAFRRVV